MRASGVREASGVHVPEVGEVLDVREVGLGNFRVPGGSGSGSSSNSCPSNWHPEKLFLGCHLIFVRAGT